MNTLGLGSKHHAWDKEYASRERKRWAGVLGALAEALRRSHPSLQHGGLLGQWARGSWWGCLLPAEGSTGLCPRPMCGTNSGQDRGQQEPSGAGKGPVGQDSGTAATGCEWFVAPACCLVQFLTRCQSLSKWHLIKSPHLTHRITMLQLCNAQLRAS